MSDTHRYVAKGSAVQYCGGAKAQSARRYHRSRVRHAPWEKDGNGKPSTCPERLTLGPAPVALAPVRKGGSGRVSKLGQRSGRILGYWYDQAGGRRVGAGFPCAA
jgi:hypothetical protein